MTRTTAGPVRTKRASRKETWTLLLVAAATVSVRQGVAAASIEETAVVAGLSAGAFYSNFADIDELTMALLARITNEAIGDIDRFLIEYPDADDYLRTTQELYRSPDRRRRTHDPVLSVELALYSLRNPAACSLLLDRLNSAEQSVTRVVETMAEGRGLGPADNRRAGAAVISAMDDGFTLHSIIDSTRDHFAVLNTALEFLSEAGAGIAVAEQLGQKRIPTRSSKDKQPTGKRKRPTPPVA